MNDIKISVIVPSYNQGKYIHNVIKSVVQQSYTNWELIIQDGASKDETAKVCSEYAALDNRITFVTEKDKGFADAVNKALDRATGTLAVIQSSDDFFAYEHVFRDVVNTYSNDPDLIIIAGASVVVDEELQHLETQERISKYIPAEKVYMLQDHFSQGATFFYLQRAFEINKLSQAVDMVADTDFWVRMASSHPIGVNTIYQTSKIYGGVMVQPEQRSSDLTKFYFGRAKMAVEHVYDKNIMYDTSFKINHANNLIQNGVRHFISMNKEIEEFKVLYRELNKAELPEKNIRNENKGLKTQIKSIIKSLLLFKRNINRVVNSKTEYYSDSRFNSLQNFKWFK